MNKDVQELIELTEETLGYADKYLAQKWQLAEQLDNLRPRLSTVGCWIPCDADNPPPADRSLLVWATEAQKGGVHYPAMPVWCDGTCYNFGDPGEDYTHYMLIGEPE